MNRLPTHRSALMGRTFGRYWRPEDYAAVTRYPAPTRTSRVAGVLLAVAIGILGAAALAHWWAS